MFKYLLTVAAAAIFFSAILCASDHTPQSVRNVLGSYQPLEHTKGQLRTGYISLSPEGEADRQSFAVGGHVHLESPEYYGIKAITGLFTVQDLGLQNSDISRVNTDFFTPEGKGYTIVGKAYLEAQWGNTFLMVGRQSIETPHADSDDLRMMPNLFMAYQITNNDIDGLTLGAMKINQMAGWENGSDASKFVKLNSAFGFSQSTDGAYVIWAEYAPPKNLSLALWGYRFSDYADLLYAEGGYEKRFDGLTLSLGVQFDRAVASGSRAGGEVDAKTWGSSLQLSYLGWSLLAAYNEENGNGGAFGSLGGGPFFTSLEDQTLDAVGARGSAYVLGSGYRFDTPWGVEMAVGAVYGRFRANTHARYDTEEIDAGVDVVHGTRFTLTLAYANINDKTAGNVGSGDYDQFRAVANLNF